MSTPPFTCAICGETFGPNPRLERWLNIKLAVNELRQVLLCWICARLRFHLDKEQRELEMYWREGVEESDHA